MVRFQIFGERCSGTNFLENLLKLNFGEDCITWDFGWKHWYVDYEKLRETSTDNDVFIVIVRNFEDWSRSFFQIQHHLRPKLDRNQWFEMPITSYWLDYCETDKNIFELRANKIKNFVGMKDIVNNYVIVQYEHLVAHSQEWIMNISKRFEIPLISEKIQNVTTYKGQGIQRYKPKKYQSFTKREQEMINANLDKNMEKLAGYE